MKSFLYKKYHPIWQAKYAIPLKRKRLEFIDQLMQGRLFNESWLDGKKFLEIGCANGKDFIQFFKSYSNLDITGVDYREFELAQNNATFHQLDAEKLPFADKQFDFCVSFGVLEHIQPIEKLCRVISEMDRVSKSYMMLVPSISTIFEPHTGQFFWQHRAKNSKNAYPCLNYFSDEAWLQFDGLKGAEVARYSYIPLFIRNSIIYKFDFS